VSSCILHTIQALDNVFGLTKSRILGLKFFGFWQRLRALYGVGEAVIEMGRAEEVDTAQREIPVTLASQSLNYRCRLES